MKKPLLYNLLKALFRFVFREFDKKNKSLLTNLSIDHYNNGQTQVFIYDIYDIYEKEDKKLNIAEQQVTTWTDQHRETLIAFARRTFACVRSLCLKSTLQKCMHAILRSSLDASMGNRRCPYTES